MTKKLEKLKNFAGVQGPVLTIVMDGVGLAVYNRLLRSAEFRVVNL